METPSGVFLLAGLSALGQGRRSRRSLVCASDESRVVRCRDPPRHAAKEASPTGGIPGDASPDTRSTVPRTRGGARPETRKDAESTYQGFGVPNPPLFSLDPGGRFSTARSQKRTRKGSSLPRKLDSSAIGERRRADPDARPGVSSSGFPRTANPSSVVRRERRFPRELHPQRGGGSQAPGSPPPSRPITSRADPMPWCAGSGVELDALAVAAAPPGQGWGTRRQSRAREMGEAQADASTIAGRSEG